MKKPLVIAAVGEGALLLGALAGYLIVIARELRGITRVLGEVTVGVRAIETHTEPLGRTVEEVRRGLEQVADRLEPVGPGGA